MVSVFLVVLSILVLVYLGHAGAGRSASHPSKVFGLRPRSPDGELLILLVILAAALVAILIAL
jgi:hypothetical protein